MVDGLIHRSVDIRIKDISDLLRPAIEEFLKLLCNRQVGLPKAESAEVEQLRC
jgi:hypothetical protein